MRYPDDHKETVRERIVRTASIALRRHGLAGVSIPSFMKDAGLTHGGFYAHFEDRDELVAEAVLAGATFMERNTFPEAAPLAEALRRYLSSSHLEHPEHGCVVAALGTDGARQPGRVRDAFAQVALGLLRLVEHKLHPERPAQTPSDEALRIASTIVGAVTLGRLVADPRLASRILKVARSATTPA